MASKEGFLDRTRLNYVDGNHETRNLALKWATLGAAVGSVGLGWGWLATQWGGLSAGFDQLQIMLFDRKGEVAASRKAEGRSYWSGFDVWSLNPFRTGRDRINKPSLRTALVGI